MITPLDPRFGKAIRLMRSTQHEGERSAARGRAEAVAAGCGLTFDQALGILDKPAQPAQPSNFFHGFDDWMEEREPGYKAKNARERQDRINARLARKKALVERFGSFQAALAPCWREAAILAAVAAWRKPCRPPHSRWTDSLDGYGSSWNDKLPPHIGDAVAAAYPPPLTFPEAKAEHDYWQQRRRDIEDLLDDDCGDDGLDLVCQIRADMVRDLVLTKIKVTTLRDLHARFAMMLSMHADEPEMEKALFRDLTAMVELEAHPSTDVSSAAPNGASPWGASMNDHPSRRGQIEDAIRADPSRSDRDVARAFGCSPTTAGKVRRALGLAGAARSVQRRGQIYTMRSRRTETTAGDAA